MYEVKIKYSQACFACFSGELSKFVTLSGKQRVPLYSLYKIAEGFAKTFSLGSMPCDCPGD